MKYAIVVEKADDGFSAYVPDLPGCIAVGDTEQETMDLLREAIEFHLEGMRLNGETIPTPTTSTRYLEVA